MSWSERVKIAKRTILRSRFMPAAIGPGLNITFMPVSGGDAKFNLFWINFESSTLVKGPSIQMRCINDRIIDFASDRLFIRKKQRVWHSIGSGGFN
ncbi:hypothetical protein BpHYR1_050205 [Brachionus plicatilis]|uniref:Uncharacterized protein n=1 Tax=Brachionus plicatilis TaxID=10195 RepID=A0A3M7SGD2_BRAPC|nr:hypothetical protein BpHYR1_050205 [Brachionus plicatilis]